MAELPPAPVPRSFGSVIWTPPTADPEPVTAGWCADHYFTDLRLAGDNRHIAEPPSAAELYWRQTTTGGLRFIPSLKGAIQTPRRYPLASSVMVPADDAWLPLPTGWDGQPWRQMPHETRRVVPLTYEELWAKEEEGGGGGGETSSCQVDPQSSPRAPALRDTSARWRGRKPSGPAELGSLRNRDDSTGIGMRRPQVLRRLGS